MPPHRRPTLRSLAAEAGVSPMTVSLALRNSPKITPATRRRILRLAELHGYRPDPVISKLMKHLSMRAHDRPKANICGLLEKEWFESPRPIPFGARLRSSLIQRAQSQGYAIDILPVSAHTTRTQLQRILLSRGVEGLVVMPIPGRHDLTDLLDWDRFSVVSATATVSQPRFHRVIPNHFDNMLTLCRKLAQGGLRRIGLAITRDWDQRVNHRWTGGLAWQNLFGKTTPVPPFLGDHPGPVLSDPRFMDWARTHQPDAIVVEYIDGELWQRALREWPAGAPPRLFTLNWPNPLAEAGIDQLVEDIGSAAIDMLSGMIARGERGIPARPVNTLVDGIWVGPRTA